MLSPVSQGFKAKRMIWTLSFAAVTIVGSIYGAGLKTQQEVKNEKKAYQQATTDEQIAVLEKRRAQLVATRAPFEKKLAALREKMRKKEQEGREGGAGAGESGKGR